MLETYPPTARSPASNRRTSREWFSAYSAISQPRRLRPGTCRRRATTCDMPAMLHVRLEHAAADPQGRHHLAGDLLDRGVGGAQHRDTLGAEQRFRRRHFALAGLELGVLRVRAPLLADLLQAHGIDGQPEQFGAVRTQARRP